MTTHVADTFIGLVAGARNTPTPSPTWVNRLENCVFILGCVEILSVLCKSYTTRNQQFNIISVHHAVCITRQTLIHLMYVNKPTPSINWVRQSKFLVRVVLLLTQFFRENSSCCYLVVLGLHLSVKFKLVQPIQYYPSETCPATGC